MPLKAATVSCFPQNGLKDNKSLEILGVDGDSELQGHGFWFSLLSVVELRINGIYPFDSFYYSCK